MRRYADERMYPVFLTEGVVEKLLRNVVYPEEGEIDAQCWGWMGPLRSRSGYGRISIGQISYPAHRVSYSLYKGSIPYGMLVRHTCDSPPCTNPLHLLVGTYSDNIMDKFARGYEGRPRAKLTWEQVEEIRRKYAATPYNKAALGREYGVTGQAIGYIVSNKQWTRR